MRVLEGRSDGDFADESLAAEHGRQLGFEQLDGDAPMVLQVLGKKHDRHPTLAKLALDPVSIAERLRELLEEFYGYFTTRSTMMTTMSTSASVETVMVWLPRFMSAALLSAILGS